MVQRSRVLGLGVWSLGPGNACDAACLVLCFSGARLDFGLDASDYLAGLKLVGTWRLRVGV